MIENFFLISPALAQTSQEGGGFGTFGALIPLVLMFVIIYFLIIRPQNKKAQAHRALVNALKRGDTVITDGGLIGKIHRISDADHCVLDLGDGLQVHLIKHSVRELLARSGENSKIPFGKKSSSKKRT